MSATLPRTALPSNRSFAADAQGDDTRDRRTRSGVAFVTGMIPHRQGAVDIAEMQLKHGADPHDRELAKAIIATRTKEIERMRSWLCQRGVQTPDH